MVTNIFIHVFIFSCTVLGADQFSKSRTLDIYCADMFFQTAFLCPMTAAPKLCPANRVNMNYLVSRYLFFTQKFVRILIGQCASRDPIFARCSGQMSLDICPPAKIKRQSCHFCEHQKYKTFRTYRIHNIVSSDMQQDFPLHQRRK